MVVSPSARRGQHGRPVIEDVDADVAAPREADEIVGEGAAAWRGADGGEQVAPGSEGGAERGVGRELGEERVEGGAKCHVVEGSAVGLRWPSVNGIVDLEEAPSDAVAAIYARALIGVRFRGAWSEAACQRIDAQLEAIDWPTEGLDDDLPQLRTYGRMLAPSRRAPRGPALAEYYAGVARDADALETLFDGELVTRLAALFGRAAGGRPAEVLGSPAPHRPATLREIGPGAEAAAHFDTYAPSPSFEHLHALTDRQVQLSFYLQLRRPERGGMLEVAEVHRERGAAAVEAERHAVPLDVGDVILFDAANHYHAVTRVEGATPRRTVGGFAALSHDRDRLYFWG